MHEAVTAPRTGWQPIALWAVGVSGAVVLSSAVVLGAAGRVTDPVTTFRLAAGPEGVTTAADAAGTSAAPSTADRWPDLEAFRIALATGSLMPRSEPVPGSWTDPATLGPITLDEGADRGQDAAAAATDQDHGAPPAGGSGGTDAGGQGRQPDADGSDNSRTITTDAGSVRVRVEDDRVQVVYATPGKGYAVSIEGDDTADLRVHLTSKDGRTRINAGVDGGSPTVVIEQDDASTGAQAPAAPADELDAG